MLTYSKSSTPPGEQTLQFCICTAMLHSLTLNRPTKFLFFQRFLLFVEFFSSSKSLHNFFLSTSLDVFSLFHRLFKHFETVAQQWLPHNINTELECLFAGWLSQLSGRALVRHTSGPGFDSGDQIFLILYCLNQLLSR